MKGWLGMGSDGRRRGVMGREKDGLRWEVGREINGRRGTGDGKDCGGDMRD